MNKKETRFEIEVGGAKGFLAPLTFPVVEAALGYTFAEIPKYLTAGAIILKSLWLRGSKSLQENGVNYDEACFQAYSAVRGIKYTFEDNVITIPFKRENPKKKGEFLPHDFKCTLKENLDRDTLEETLGLILPNGGNPRPLTAGKMILEKNWESGDKEIKTNGELLIAASLACYYLIKFKGGTLKKV